LRYINKIKRSILGLENVEWRELLSPNIIGMLNSPDTVNSVEMFECSQGITLADNGGNARILSKLATEGNPAEPVFTIDGDFFFKGNLETANVMEKLNFLNSRSSRLIRWAITPRLHEALEPQPL
jgi:uncharacterized protein (TIGR04255 family)